MQKNSLNNGGKKPGGAACKRTGKRETADEPGTAFAQSEKTDFAPIRNAQERNAGTPNKKRNNTEKIDFFGGGYG